MEGSWLDSIPNHERQKLRRRMSPEAYERLREKVKGPEDLEKEMERSKEFAELQFELQTDPELREKVHAMVRKSVGEEGLESAFDLKNASPEAKKLLERGKFSVAVESHPVTQQEHLVAVPEGNVQEKIPLRPAVSDRVLAQAVQSASAGQKLKDLRKRARA